MSDPWEGVAWRVCQVCGHGDNEPRVQPSLVQMAAEPHPYEDAIRCRDVAACKARAAAKGISWPFLERRPVDHGRISDDR